MGSFSIEWKLSAEKDIRNLEKKYINRIVNSIENLAYDPFPPQYRKLKTAEAMYRLKVGNYRVIYQIDFSNNIITITYIRHRKTAYRSL